MTRVHCKKCCIEIKLMRKIQDPNHVLKLYIFKINFENSFFFFSYSWECHQVVSITFSTNDYRLTFNQGLVFVQNSGFVAMNNSDLIQNITQVRFLSINSYYHYVHFRKWKSSR